MSHRHFSFFFIFFAPFFSSNLARRLCVCVDHRLRGDKRQARVDSVGDLVPDRTPRCAGNLVDGHHHVSRALLVLVRDTITRDSGVFSKVFRN